MLQKFQFFGEQNDFIQVYSRVCKVYVRENRDMTEKISRKRGEIPPAKKAVGLFILNLIAGFGIPMMVDLVSKDLFKFNEEVLIGLMIAISMTLAETLYMVQHIYETELIQSEAGEIRTQLDIQLHNIRSSMQALASAQDGDAFYFAHYFGELQFVQHRLLDAIGRYELVLDRHHIDGTNKLLSIFDGSQHSEFCATHPMWVWANINTFDITYQVYFEKWIEKLIKREVKVLRRIFVYRNLSEFDTFLSRKLVAFHLGSIPGLEAKIVTESDFLRFKQDFGIADGVDDIGIFSDKYLYLGISRRNENISGTFSRDKVRIEKYTACFDSLWGSAAAKALSSMNFKPLSLEELFDPSISATQI